MSDNQCGKQMRIRDIAEVLGVSTATVSNVIHNKTAKISAATKVRLKIMPEAMPRKKFAGARCVTLLSASNSRSVGRSAAGGISLMMVILILRIAATPTNTAQAI